jgi:hypothetical protein
MDCERWLSPPIPSANASAPRAHRVAFRETARSAARIAAPLESPFLLDDDRLAAGEPASTLGIGRRVVELKMVVQA